MNKQTCSLVIGAGSFARVYEFRHLAWKTVLHTTKEDNDILREEYQQLSSLSWNLEREASSPFRFIVPAAQAYYNPAEDMLLRRHVRNLGVLK